MSKDLIKLVGKDRLVATLHKIQRDLIDSDRLIDWAGPQILDYLIARTAKAGRDVYDRPFAPYSADYAKIKGRRSPVTLVGTGAMLDLTRWKKTGKLSGEIVVEAGGSPDRAMIAEVHNQGAGRMPERRWMGLSPAGLKAVNKDLLDWIDYEIEHIVETSDKILKKIGRAVKGSGIRVSKPA